MCTDSLALTSITSATPAITTKITFTVKANSAALATVNSVTSDSSQMAAVANQGKVAGTADITAAVAESAVVPVPVPESVTVTATIGVTGAVASLSFKTAIAAKLAASYGLNASYAEVTITTYSMRLSSVATGIECPDTGFDIAQFEKGIVDATGIIDSKLTSVPICARRRSLAEDMASESMGDMGHAVVDNVSLARRRLASASASYSSTTTNSSIAAPAATAMSDQGSFASSLKTHIAAAFGNFAVTHLVSLTSQPPSINTYIQYTIKILSTHRSLLTDVTSLTGDNVQMVALVDGVRVTGTAAITSAIATSSNSEMKVIGAPPPQEDAKSAMFSIGLLSAGGLLVLVLLGYYCYWKRTQWQQKQHPYEARQPGDPEPVSGTRGPVAAAKAEFDIESPRKSESDGKGLDANIGYENLRSEGKENVEYDDMGFRVYPKDNRYGLAKKGEARDPRTVSREIAQEIRELEKLRQTPNTNASPRTKPRSPTPLRACTPELREAGHSARRVYTPEQIRPQSTGLKESQLNDPTSGYSIGSLALGQSLPSSTDLSFGSRRAADAVGELSMTPRDYSVSSQSGGKSLHSFPGRTPAKPDTIQVRPIVAVLNHQTVVIWR